MGSRYPTNGLSGQVSSMKNLDVRRLWEKMHTSDVRENCYTYYREARFDQEPPRARVKQGHSRRVTAGKMSFLQRISVKSTELRVIMAVAGVMGLGIGITRFLAASNQSSSVERVESYMDSIRTDWEKYQSNIHDSSRKS